MLSSKEKRRIRRTAEKMEKRTTFEGRGMDVMPFYAKTDSQEDLWKSLNKNTVTIAVGPAGVGKTLVAALWFGLSAIKAKAFSKVIYVRSDVGCAHQRGRGACQDPWKKRWHRSSVHWLIISPSFAAPMGLVNT